MAALVPLSQDIHLLSMRVLFKGGDRWKILGVKGGGGVIKENPSSSAITASVIMQTVYHAQKPAYIQIFPGKHAAGSPFL